MANIKETYLLAIIIVVIILWYISREPMDSPAYSSRTEYENRTPPNHIFNQGVTFKQPYIGSSFKQEYNRFNKFDPYTRVEHNNIPCKFNQCRHPKLINYLGEKTETPMTWRS